MRKKKSKLKWVFMICMLAVILIAAGVLLYRYYPVIAALGEPENIAIFRDWLQSFGWEGALLLLGLQIVQVISGIVPALPIQLAAGLSYGALFGMLICMSGVTLGSILVFSLVKRFGQPVVDKAFPPEKQNRLAFLRNARTLEPIVFILYLIPAMPKDVFTYLAALTPLSLRRYLCLTLIARAPTIFCTVFASNSLIDGNYGRAIGVFCITSILGITSMVFGKRILAFLEKASKKQ